MALEWALGSKLAAAVENHILMVSDSALTNYLNAIEQKIVLRSRLDGCFVVKLIDDPEPNAYSLPGGFLYVTTGFMRDAETEGQLGAALAHETAHVTARHLTTIEARRRFWGRLALALGPVGCVIRTCVGPVLTSKMLRSAELNADLAGLKYDIAAGYDPEEFVSLLEINFSDVDTPSSLFERLYDSHPSTSTRLKRLRHASIAVKTPQTFYTVDTSDFADAKARLATITH